MFEECLYFNSNALARTVTRIWTEAYKPFGLSPPHAFFIKVVLAKPGVLPRELAEQLNLSRSTVTRFLDSLENKGFITRKTTGNDGREIQIFPTLQAKKLEEKLAKTRDLLTKQMQETIGDDVMANAVTNFREIRETIEKR